MDFRDRSQNRCGALLRDGLGNDWGKALVLVQYRKRYGGFAPRFRIEFRCSQCLPK